MYGCHAYNVLYTYAILEVTNHATSGTENILIVHVYFVRVLTSVSFKGKMVHSLFSVRETEGTPFYMGPRRATVIEVTQRYRLKIPLGPSRATLYTCALITYKPYRRRDSDMDDKRARKKSYTAISASWATRATFPGNAGMRVLFRADAFLRQRVRAHVTEWPLLVLSVHGYKGHRWESLGT